MATSTEYWLGYVTMAAALSTKAEPKAGQKHVRGALSDFLKAPAPSEDVRALQVMVKQEMTR